MDKLKKKVTRMTVIVEARMTKGTIKTANKTKKERTEEIKKRKNGR